jgi:hypothetical protein
VSATETLQANPVASSDSAVAFTGYTITSQQPGFLFAVLPSSRTVNPGSQGFVTPAHGVALGRGGDGPAHDLDKCAIVSLAGGGITICLLRSWL